MGSSLHLFVQSSEPKMIWHDTNQRCFSIELYKEIFSLHWLRNDFLFGTENGKEQ